MQTKKKKIKDIAEVILGFTFRSTLEESMDGNIAVLQAKNITEKIIINEDDLIKIELDKNRTSAMAENNDVVISSRGNFKSAVLRSGQQPIIAAGSTYLIRLKSDEVMPEYLAVYLNSAIAQKQIKERTSGVVINALPKRGLEDIEVIIPSQEQQQKTVAVYENNLHLQKLLKQKQYLTGKVNEGLINKLINS